MFSASMDLAGMAGALAFLAAVPAAVDRNLGREMKTRADYACTRFIATTPRGKTGNAIAGWRVVRVDMLSYAVVNETKSPRGFPYPAALITGTGTRGRPGAAGFTGSFSATWPGMAPTSALRAEWDFQSTAPFTTARLFEGL